MLHLAVLAMIDLWAIDPDAVQPPPAQIGQRLAGASDASDALRGSEAPGPSAVSICTYGAPPLGAQFWGDANQVMRSFTTPSCADATSGFQSGLPSQSLFGVFPLGMALPWATVVSPGTPVHLAGGTKPSQSRPAFGVPGGGTAPNILLHLPRGERGSSSAASHASSEQGSAARRLPH